MISEDNTVTLFVGRKEDAEELKVTRRGRLGGMMGYPCSYMAKDDGENVYFVDIEWKCIATTEKLLNDIAEDKLYDAFLRSVGVRNMHKKDLFWRAIIEGDIEYSMIPEICETLNIKSADNAYLECQRIRGRVAELLGFKAITSLQGAKIRYLILPRVKLKRYHRG